MRILLTTILLCAGATSAAADDAPPELVFMPDLDAETGLRVRFGAASVDGVRDRGTGLAAHTVLLSAVRAAYAPRHDLELSIAASAAVLASNDYDTDLSTDAGLAMPALGVEWTRAAGRRVRLGLGALASFGGIDRSMDRSPHPGDVAAGAFFVDPEVAWSGAHMGLVHGGIGWSNGVTTVRGDLGIQGYAGGALPEPVSILRVSGGIAHRLGPRHSVSFEGLVETDAHHEAVSEDTDVVPALTFGLRRHGRWDVGGGLTLPWTPTGPAGSRSGLVALLDLRRTY
jgi:hypothetical protein